MKAISHPGQITSISARADGSLGYRVVTPELSSTEKAEFMALQNANLQVLIKPTDEEPADALIVEKQMEGKTPSQRLRAVLFVLWKQKGEKGIFDNFYRTAMEAAINRVKDQLEEEGYKYE